MTQHMLASCNNKIEDVALPLQIDCGTSSVLCPILASALGQIVSKLRSVESDFQARVL